MNIKTLTALALIGYSVLLSSLPANATSGISYTHPSYGYTSEARSVITEAKVKKVMCDSVINDMRQFQKMIDYFIRDSHGADKEYKKYLDKVIAVNQEMLARDKMLLNRLESLDLATFAKLTQELDRGDFQKLLVHGWDDSIKDNIHWKKVKSMVGDVVGVEYNFSSVTYRLTFALLRFL